MRILFIVPVLFFLTSPFKAYSQVADIHDMLFVAGTGEPAFPREFYNAQPIRMPLFLKAEYDIKRQAAIGLSFSRYSTFIDDTVKISTNRLHFKFVKYLIMKQRFAFYISPSFGYNLNLINSPNTSLRINEKRIPVSFSFQLGTRFLLTKHIGMYCEYFYDISMFQLGGFYKIYRK